MAENLNSVTMEDGTSVPGQGQRIAGGGHPPDSRNPRISTENLVPRTAGTEQDPNADPLPPDFDGARGAVPPGDFGRLSEIPKLPSSSAEHAGWTTGEELVDFKEYLEKRLGKRTDKLQESLPRSSKDSRSLSFRKPKDHHGGSEPLEKTRTHGLFTPTQSEVDFSQFPALTDHITRRVSSRVCESAGFDVGVLDWIRDTLQIAIPDQPEDWEQMETEKLAEFRKIVSETAESLDLDPLDSEAGQAVVSLLVAILGGFRKTAEHYAQLKTDLVSSGRTAVQLKETRKTLEKSQERMEHYRSQRDLLKEQVAIWKSRAEYSAQKESDLQRELEYANSEINRITAELDDCAQQLADTNERSLQSKEELRLEWERLEQARANLVSKVQSVQTECREWEKRYRDATEINKDLTAKMEHLNQQLRTGPSAISTPAPAAKSQGLEKQLEKKNAELSEIWKLLRELLPQSLLGTAPGAISALAEKTEGLYRENLELKQQLVELPQLKTDLENAQLQAEALQAQLILALESQETQGHACNINTGQDIARDTGVSGTIPEVNPKFSYLFEGATGRDTRPGVDTGTRQRTGNGGISGVPAKTNLGNCGISSGPGAESSGISPGPVNGTLENRGLSSGPGKESSDISSGPKGTLEAWYQLQEK
jgi:uncharacterized protein YoxC